MTQEPVSFQIYKDLANQVGDDVYNKVSQAMKTSFLEYKIEEKEFVNAALMKALEPLLQRFTEMEKRLADSISDNKTNINKKADKNDLDIIRQDLKDIVKELRSELKHKVDSKTVTIVAGVISSVVGVAFTVISFVLNN